ncbi:MAG: quinone-dependent dihydroorotate dehydrogenase [Rhodanobacter sp.]|nr:MAG: quinone-dependent dihydroorotate dehydrogenase [Rhodanobacter sp.]TAM12130.1 MAG: quinone-dependent dihydroorotate dehydrogenase [Rhodanobacter sp.]TAM34771.1 MAG: quinone-dependent dihydroorotate dehydrogenase [Rhodanobacter sp.]
MRPLLFALDAEAAHGSTLRALDLAHRLHLLAWFVPPVAAAPTTAFGVHFPNPVGLAAGLDKNAEHLDALGALGFGFIEVGTVTPRAQPGNPRPRLFRLPQHAAIINRMGFNNAGVDAFMRNVGRARYDGVLGINIGKNKDTPNERAVDDYLTCLEHVYARASYITVNISSPNTKGLRDLQHEDALHRLIGTLRETQERLGSQAGARKPMLLKIAPDLGDAELDGIAQVLQATGIDGVICTNTTVDHTLVANHPLGHETGGLSGRPLFALATDVLRGMRARLGPQMPIIGVGGILAGADAAEKINAGANLVQLYSGLIYRGPRLVAECVDAIRNLEGTRRAA